jgi:arylsulfatase A
MKKEKVMTSKAWSRRAFLKSIGAATGAGLLTSTGCASLSATADKPNIVVIFMDDMGYADIGVTGAKGYKTPNIDRMAAEGMHLTNFYAAAPSCTPSRAALITGCYPQRVSLPNVIGPNTTIGLNEKEETIADLLKPLGYATACFGKWHMGHHPEFLPLRHGFDEYFGLPYSNDMWPKHPTAGDKYPPLPLVEGEKTLEYNPDQTQLTTWYTERSVDFIERNKSRPFFLYLPHSMVHVPLFVSDKFKGRSDQGLFGDVMMEVDWSVGQVLDTLRRNGLDRKTLVFFCSDNGPWLSYGDHAGSAAPFREGKGTTWDGGQREATLAWWPGRIHAGSVCAEPGMTIDVLPTVASIVGAKMPKQKIDGLDISPLLFGEQGAKSPHEALYFYKSYNLEAVRSGKWKLHFPHEYRSLDGKPGGTGGYPTTYVQKKIGLALYDLENDVGEQNDVAKEHPKVVERLKKLGERARHELGDTLTKRKGAEVREPGRLS